MTGLFITGTDTGVGKTVVSAALMHCFRRQTKACYWKPIQTGVEQDDDTAEVRHLGACAENEILDQGIRLEKPVSPHLAAQWAGTRIDLSALLNSVRMDPETHWIVEGAGGVLVPINETDLMTHWMRLLGLPVVIAARSGLGTINHTLLSIEALRARAIPIAGVVMVGVPNADNLAAIERYGSVPVLGELPPFHPLSPQALAEWSGKYLDANLILAACQTPPAGNLRP